MKIDAVEIGQIIRKRLQGFESYPEIHKEGNIVSVQDGIVQIYGMQDVMCGEMLEFSNNVWGIALNLERDLVGTMILGDYTSLKEGQKVKSSGKVFEVGVGKGFLGRVVNALGVAIDGKGKVDFKKTSPIEKIAPGIIYRQSVNQPLQTGIKAIDAMVPIGKGQRELIIGDHQTGKTTIALDTIINQRDKNVFCIYVAIGQKASTVASFVHKLSEHNALDYTIVVDASSSEPVSLQYIAPYVGCTMGEYFRDLGQDALIVYDDLTKHAWAYRQISLLLRRPPGREAYPGDIFYLHSRLLERAACVNTTYVEQISGGEVKNKCGSLTALPIIETQAGDVSSFVPTNVISITDGQIFLQSDLFCAGVRPAINAGISVSRVGGAAQSNIMKKLAGKIRLTLAQYRELEAFAQFASDLDESTRKQLDRGERTVEILNQKPFDPMDLSRMIISLYCVDNDYLNDLEIKKISEFENKLQKYFKRNYLKIYNDINKTGEYNDDIKSSLDKVIRDFKEKEVI